MNEINPTYSTGDKVKIVKYGHLIWQHKSDEQKLSFPIIDEDENLLYLDMNSKIVGKVGIISQVRITQGVPRYSIEGIPEKHAWYDEEQLDLVSKNPNTI